MMTWRPPVAAPEGETPQQWAARVLAQHGPPPPPLVQHLRRLRTQAATARKRSA